jgi:hypothetical protein
MFFTLVLSINDMFVTISTATTITQHIVLSYKTFVITINKSTVFETQRLTHLSILQNRNIKMSDQFFVLIPKFALIQ